MSFAETLNRAIARNNSLLAIGLDPNPELLPPGTDWLAHLQAIVEQTYDRACAYKLSLGLYLAQGAAGMDLLTQVLAAIPDDMPTILDAKHGDLNASSYVAETAFATWGIDAITVTPYAGQDAIAPFLLYSNHAVFVLCHTSNPTAAEIQDYPATRSPDIEPLYLEVVRAARGWGTHEQVALEVGTTDPAVLAAVRSLAPERWILVRSLWSLADVSPLLKAGLDRYGSGLLVPAPVDVLAGPDVGREVAALNETIAQSRAEATRAELRCELWQPDVCLLVSRPHQQLILQLFDLDCFLFGNFVQASGERFAYYIDLRKAISNPEVFQLMLHAYAELLRPLEFDRIAGIPYGALPTATGLSLYLQQPMIYPRKEVKAHGTRRAIEGHFLPGETAVVVDDILISGKSAIEGAQKLEAAGLKVRDIVVFVDHGRGVGARLENCGYKAHAVLTLEAIAETLLAAGRINADQHCALTSEIA
ncbi:orotidine 5'-phosphate decarboxylase, subfamily 2 [Rubidibacter lacunae KORDI 51-2]|uniref:Orotate phosphoribosyltransferase n=1 Tax=Rubidibacter lacunae KORDI 51-2 TaxID=582515 RepID=U5DKF0_9CHRO|nr:bifunctional orotidine-5'-phosphate decarboxylase/orotate phosphoribosyltransferase [Rubidibacter lacunae]ERN41049.1 orotidine 5'-phosphate decarboxylase, subfamily 2 [Rubidibacter lacunae KORDI 51-2]